MKIIKSVRFQKPDRSFGFSSLIKNPLSNLLRGFLLTTNIYKQSILKRLVFIQSKVWIRIHTVFMSI